LGAILQGYVCRGWRIFARGADKHTARSYVLCEALRSISTDRLSRAPRGRVSPQTMARVVDTLRILLEL